MITPEMVLRLWDEFCASFPQFVNQHDLKARLAYFAGYRACLEQASVAPHLGEVMAAFEAEIFRTAVAIKERKRPFLDRGEIIGHGTN